MDLFALNGYEHTTVAEIAERAGLTERTFFRYFTDKREVLFTGAVPLREFLVSGVDRAPASLAPMKAVMTALCDAGDAIFEERRDFARRRQAIVAANPELQERELIKLAALASALADALRRRGVSASEAALASEAGITAFKIAFSDWVDDPRQRTLSDHIQASVAELRDVTAGRQMSPRP
jgi:AcrR family transcriptional regulator